MTLPLQALEKLASWLRQGIENPRPMLRTGHTLPVERRIWAATNEGLITTLRSFLQVGHDLAQPTLDFKAVKERIERLLGLRKQTISVIHSLQPFEPFDATRASQLISLMDDAVSQIALVLEGKLEHVDTLLEIAGIAERGT